jgi:hypothetical protein
MWQRVRHRRDDVPVLDDLAIVDPEQVVVGERDPDTPSDCSSTNWPSAITLCTFM